MQTPHRDVQEAEAAAELAQTDERASEAERRLGSLRQQLEADDAVRRKAALIEAELKTARTSADKWAKLSGLIGSADGKTFRLAAQSLTFALLLHEANVILSRMQSRYQLIPAGSQNSILQSETWNSRGSSGPPLICRAVRRSWFRLLWRLPFRA